jgi:hypothetical protein
MNERLQDYLRSLGLAANATDDEAAEFVRGLRGLQATVANLLNYANGDEQARTNCDLALRALGLDPADPAQTAPPPTDAAADADAGHRSEPVDPETLERARREGIEAERGRVAEIRQLGELAGTPAEIVERLVANGGTTVEAARQAILADTRARRTADVDADLPRRSPTQHSRNSRTNFEAGALAAALQLRYGVADPMRSCVDYNPRTGSMRRRDRSGDAELERQVDRGYELSGLALRDIVVRCLAADGIQCDPTAAAIGAAIRDNAHTRAFSTLTLTGVFSQSISALLLQGFERAADSTEGWVRHRDVPNFLTQERTRLQAGGTLKRLPSGGTADHVHLQDAKEEYKAHRFAALFKVDEQDLINDTLGALDGAGPEEIGKSAAEVVADLVYSVLLANAAMRDGTALFEASSHLNLATSTALGVDSVSAMAAAMAIQQENDHNLNLRLAYLIVPQTLRLTALAIAQSSGLIIASGEDATTLRPQLNPNAREGLQVRSDARLDNGLTDPVDGTAHAGSTSTWFGAAEAGSHTIEVGHVRGTNRLPTMRTSVLTEGQFGLAFDVTRDVGAKALDWRGLAKRTA